VDLLPLLDPENARKVASIVVPRLKAMGAAASARLAARFS
jgi:hypothetical protein